MTGTDPQEFQKWLALLPPTVRERLTLIPLCGGGKEPDVKFGESWNNPKYHLTASQAIGRLKAGLNVGVDGTKDTIAVLDIERQNTQKAQSHIPLKIIDTLIGKTRNGGLHLYYLNGGVPNRDLTEDGKKIVEVRADNRYVVAPGSFVPPDEGEGGGNGLYRVVNERPPLLLTPSDLPWLAEKHEYKIEPVNFEGEFLSLPCVHMLFEVPLQDGRKNIASKLLGIAWVLDHKSADGFEPVAKNYANFQGRPDRPIPWRYVWGRAASAARNKLGWSCGEMICLLRNNDIYPPCSGCPLKMKQKRWLPRA